MARAQGLASYFIRRSLLPSQSPSSSLPRTSTAILQHFTSFSSTSSSSSSSSSSSCNGSHFLSPTCHLPFSSRPLSLALAGAVSFSFAASSFSTEAALAKEPLSADRLPRNVVLYQYEACPFCNKVKAFLDYHDIPYKVVEVNPLSKKEIKWSDYKKVPILTVEGEQLVDSSEIIEKLSRRVHPKEPVFADDEEKKWRRWVDDHLVHVLSPNIYRSASEALESFDYITSNGNFSFTEKLTVKYAGAAAMYFVSKKLKKKHNITDERAALYEAAETWVEALNGRNFLGGSKPNLADLAVFGVLRPIRYLRSGRDMVDNTRIGEWYTRMETAVGESSRINA